MKNSEEWALEGIDQLGDCPTTSLVGRVAWAIEQALSQERKVVAEELFGRAVTWYGTSAAPQLRGVARWVRDRDKK